MAKRPNPVKPPSKATTAPVPASSGGPPAPIPSTGGAGGTPTPTPSGGAGAVGSLPSSLANAIAASGASSSSTTALQDQAQAFLNKLTGTGGAAGIQGPGLGGPLGSNPANGYSAQLAQWQMQMAQAMQAAGQTPPSFTYGYMDPITLSDTEYFLNWQNLNPGVSPDPTQAIQVWSQIQKDNGAAAAANSEPFPIPVALSSAQDVIMASDTIAKNLLGRRATLQERTDIANVISNTKIGQAYQRKAGTTRGENAGLTGQPTAGVNSPISAGAAGLTGQPANIQAVLNTIKNRESGDYGSRAGNNTDATGAYQFIGSTWRSLTAQFGIGTQYQNAGDAPPNIQDQVAAAYVQQILQQNGGDVSKIPLIWYTGNPQGQISASALAANNGLQPATYQANWMQEYNSQAGGGVSATPTPPSSSIDVSGANAAGGAGQGNTTQPSGSSIQSPIDTSTPSDQSTVIPPPAGTTGGGYEFLPYQQPPTPEAAAYNYYRQTQPVATGAGDSVGIFDFMQSFVKGTGS